MQATNNDASVIDGVGQWDDRGVAVATKDWIKGQYTSKFAFKELNES